MIGIEHPSFKKGLRSASSASEVVVDNIERFDLNASIERAASAVLADQAQDGHWCYPLEADCTITAEYIMMNHFIGDPETLLEQRMVHYLRSNQLPGGGWPLFHGGAMDISCSVKSYFALKLAGEDVDAEHMVRARKVILENGGAAKSNVFTRIALALFRQIPWRAIPHVPVEIVLFPKWFFFHLSKVSYWSRTVMVPLAVLCTLRPKPAASMKTSVRELFVLDPEKEMNYFPPNRTLLSKLFFLGDRIAHMLHPIVPSLIRKRALTVAEKWIIARLNGTDGMGGIFPAMVNTYEALAALGYKPDHPYQKNTRQAIRDLVDDSSGKVYCQPCVSPIWDTAITVLALTEVGDPKHRQKLEQSLDWLVPLQILNEPGDWQDNRPNLLGGGWAFQYRNDYYPDVDDTPMVAWAMRSFDSERYAHAIERAKVWIAGMQSRNGGYGAFDADNTYFYLNNIPFADHGALLDPPTSDVTARCLTSFSFAKVEKSDYVKVRDRIVDFLRAEQEKNGAWYGRWGTNYIYGTWSVLTALEESGMDMQQGYIQKAADWLESVQRGDGGWGESNLSYYDTDNAGQDDQSSACHTAWALLGLISAGRYQSASVEQGIQYLLLNQSDHGTWEDLCFNAPGFPRVFFLRYHGYSKFFPLWALAKYRTALRTN